MTHADGNGIIIWYYIQSENKSVTVPQFTHTKLREELSYDILNNAYHQDFNPHRR